MKRISFRLQILAAVLGGFRLKKQISSAKNNKPTCRGSIAEPLIHEAQALSVDQGRGSQAGRDRSQGQSVVVKMAQTTMTKISGDVAPRLRFWHVGQVFHQRSHPGSAKPESSPQAGGVA